VGWREDVINYVVGCMTNTRFACNVANSVREFQRRECSAEKDYRPPLEKDTRGENSSPPEANETYGRGQSGIVGTPEEGTPTFGRGASGLVGTPEDSFVTFGLGASGRVGTPLAKEMA